MKKLFLPALLFNVVTAFAQVPTAGLTHAYTFKNQNAIDEVGSINGVLANCTPVPDRFGNVNNAYSFNGSTSSINLGISSNLMPVNGTVSIWAKREGLAPTNSNIPSDPIFLAKNTSTAAYFEGASIGVNRSNATWTGITTLNQAEKVVSKAGVSDNVWHHVVLAYDTDSVRLYIDGSLVHKVVKGFASQFSTTLPTYLGYSGNASYLGYFKGSMDDLRIYNRVLSKYGVDSLYRESGWAPTVVNCGDLLLSNANLKHQYSFNCANANDEVGAMNGTVAGATFVSDRFGNTSKAMNFNGSNNSVDLGASSTLMSVNGSISLWAKRTGNAASNSGMSYDPIFMAKNPSTANYFEGLSIGVQRASGNWIAVSTLNQNEKVAYKTGLSNNTWHHVVVTYDTDFLKFYVDGTLAQSVAKGFASQFSAAKAYLGYTGSSTNLGYFNGAIDDLLFFDKVLTPNEVAVLNALGNTVTSLEEETAIQSENLVYPNPVLDVLNVNGKAEIFSLTGQKLLEGTDKINVSELNKGIYIVRSNNTVTKIVKE